MLDKRDKGAERIVSTMPLPVSLDQLLAVRVALAPIAIMKHSRVAASKSSLLGGGGLLSSLLRFLGLFLRHGGLPLDGVDFLDHEGTGDAVTDLLVGEHSTVGSGDSALGVRETAVCSGSCD